MGDFKPDAKLKESLPAEVLLGIENHRLVDRATDRFAAVKELKSLFSPDRRRYAGVVTDIAFDYFLIKHWESFDQSDFNKFVESCYSGLLQCHHLMPPRMGYVVEKMHEYDWLSSYRSMDGIGATIDQVSKRIRFENNMQGSIVEVEKNYAQIEAVFLDLFEHLTDVVNTAELENKIA